MLKTQKCDGTHFYPDTYSQSAKRKRDKFIKPERINKRDFKVNVLLYI